MKTIAGFEGLQSFLDKFNKDHPDVDKNVFIAMRFRQGKQFQEIHQAIKISLAKYGLRGVRADDRVYPLDGDLWSNVCVYMMACKYAVCVFEEIDEREFNPNVPLEYGFMRALNRQVLLLKDSRMPCLPTDMTGKIYRLFDSYNIAETIQQQVGEWVERDLGIRPVSERPEILTMIEKFASNTVLILGRFTPERKIVLDAIREELRKRDYQPVLFDFEKPAMMDLTRTIFALAVLSRFIIADLTDPSTVPHELRMVAPSTVVPIQTILQEGQREHAMFVDLTKRYHWVLAPYEYKSKDLLIAHLNESVIAPAEAKAKELTQSI